MRTTTILLAAIGLLRPREAPPIQGRGDHNRQVPAPEATLDALADLRDYSAMTEHDGETPPATAYVFLSRDRLAVVRRYMADHDGRLSASYVLVPNMGRAFRSLQRRAGLDGDRSLHDLRRSYGTAQAAAGIPIHELSRFMGHSSIKTTQDYYLGATAGVEQMARSAVTIPTP